MIAAVLVSMVFGLFIVLKRGNHPPLHCSPVAVFHGIELRLAVSWQSQKSCGFSFRGMRAWEKVGYGS
jgi:hypothetical protein